MAFTTPPESAAEQYALSICLSVLASVMVGLRFLAIRARKNEYGMDDWWILVALVFTWATAIVNIVGAAAGNEGQHTELDAQGMPILTERYEVFLKAILANQLVQLGAVGATKLSVLLFYRRIFVGRIFNFITWILMILVCLWTVGFFLGNVLECIPLSRAWAHVVGGYPDPQCVDAVSLYLAQAWADVFLDVLILVIPVPLVWQLQMPFKRRLAVYGIFLIGLLTVAASTAKLVIQLNIGGEIAGVADVSYFLTPIMYWPLIEAALGITAACLPKMRILFTEGHGFHKLYYTLRSSFSNVSKPHPSSRSGRSRPPIDLSDPLTGEHRDIEMGRDPITMKPRIFGSKVNIDFTGAVKTTNGLHSPDTILVEREYGSSLSNIHSTKSNDQQRNASK